MKLSIKESGEGVLALSGELTIERAEELRLKLLKSIKKVGTLVLNLKKVTKVDLSCIQLLCSTNRTFYEENKQISIQDNGGSDVFNTVMRDAGFSGIQCISEKYCNNCIWEEGTNR